MTIAPETPPVATVVVDDVPARRFLAFHEHLDALVGELAVIAARIDGPRPPAVDRLMLLLEGLGGPFAAVRQASRLAAITAVRSGQAAFAMAAELPLSSLRLIGLWNQLLDEADWASSRGLLLTMPAPPELVELRRWIGEQISKALQTGDETAP